MTLPVVIVSENFKAAWEKKSKKRIESGGCCSEIMDTIVSIEDSRGITTVKD